MPGARRRYCLPKYQVTMTCTVSDPAERQRRLAHVCELPLDQLVGPQQTADVTAPDRLDTSAVGNAPARRA
jgi:hypothetical protein